MDLRESYLPGPMLSPLSDSPPSMELPGINCGDSMDPEKACLPRVHALAALSTR